MVPPTRRRLLQVATAAAGTLAGCGGLTDDAVRSSRSSSASDETNIPDGTVESDPAFVLLRSDSERPLLRFEDEGGGDDSPPARTHARLTNTLIDTDSRSRRLVVEGDEDGERVSSFVAETDFDRETLYLESRWIRECFRLRLCSISWEPTKVRTHYVRRLRPWDERCTAGAHVAESRLIRIPAALEESSVSGYGSSTSGSGQCDRSRAPDSGER